MIVAQTNLQLYRQLETSGWSTKERRRAEAAYTLAAELHSGQYRASSKTFVAHLCGTASIADAAGGTVDETLAALLHAAYDQGDFGDGRTPRTPSKCAEIRDAIGADAEALVAQYSDWPWRDTARGPPRRRTRRLRRLERAVAFLRLANEVEERVDGADDYAPAHAVFVFPLDDVVRCARLLGREALVALADDVARANPVRDAPADLQTTTYVSGPVAPRSSSTRALGARDR